MICTSNLVWTTHLSSLIPTTITLGNYLEQIRIVRQTLINRDWNQSIRDYVRGFMIESYIEDGRQDNTEIYGKSITDPCLGWEKTEELIREIYER